MAEWNWRRLLPLVFVVLGVLPSLLAESGNFSDDPGWDGNEYVLEARDLADGTYGEQSVARYPPGWPMMMLPFDAVGSPYVAAKFWALALYAAAVAAAWKIRGPWAGAVAGVLVGFSPFLTSSAANTMSDGPAALLAIGALMLPRAGAWLAGFSLVVRYSSIGWIAPLALLRRSWLPVLAAFAVCVLVFQWAVYGEVGATGYTEGSAEMGLSFFDEPLLVGSDWYEPPILWRHHMPPADEPIMNLPVYLLTLGGWYSTFLPPGVALLGVWALWRRRDTELARSAAVLIVGSVGLYCFYFWQDTRFIAPAALVLSIFTGVGVVDAARRFRSVADSGQAERARLALTAATASVSAGA